MPILGSFGAGSARGLGLTSGGVAVYEFQYLVVAGGGGGGHRESHLSLSRTKEWLTVTGTMT